MHDTGATFADKKTPPVLITLILVTSISVLTMNAFIPSLPALADDLGSSYAFMQIAVSGYLLMTAFMQLLIGPLSDRYGRRPVILISLVIFILASLGCIIAEDGETFMIFRMCQAAVASGMVLSRTIVRDLLEPNEAASMIGYMTAAMALVPMFGPMYGGAMEEALGWRATFWSFVVFGTAILWLCWIDLGETNKTKSSSFKEQIKAYPDLLRARRFWGYTLTAAFASGSFFALLGGGPFVGREIFGLSPAATGLYLGMIAFGYMSGNLITGRYASRMGINRTMMAGCLISTFGIGTGLLINLFVVQHPLAVFGFCVFVGLGNGLTMPSATTGILSVRPGLAGSASGLGSAMMIGGGAGLSALAGALLSKESGAAPLLMLMVASAICSVVATFYVIRRAKTVGAT
ncbi:MAG: multidrug effflux MFS transporter [Paracoccaceae bacterium]|jgi:DHA1 family bicyclomycin/chloramphenicol resistance-like MFS transporter|nr:multidrug effflux MFS transporter [Paracoccaceae bacterium]MDG1369241.1 multidrug effflux MFS transporter [Paracoccaceae bacterium]